jgi:hypothetical protein
VIGKFNGHLQDCVLFVADEAYWGGDKRCVGSLQGMITEPPQRSSRRTVGQNGSSSMKRLFLWPEVRSWSVLSCHSCGSIPPRRAHAAIGGEAIGLGDRAG